MDAYTEQEQEHLLYLARETLEAVTRQKPPPRLDFASLPPALQAERACFVTLRHCHSDALRGCTGTLVARYPLAREVIVTTEQTALHDPRFPAVVASEIDELHIEISVLTPMKPLPYTDADDLLRKLRPGIDGVTLEYGRHRATFLPQVWERVTDPTVFLGMLSNKMGLASSAWRQVKMRVHVYQTVIIEEPRNSHA